MGRLGRSLLWLLCITASVSNALFVCNVPGKACFGITIPCPSGCPTQCAVNCNLCRTSCGCNKPGSICQDPRFVGGDGVVFYFHGQRNADFCIVADSHLHINAHFIGKPRDSKRDFTWVQSLGILFGTHQLFLGAKKVATWDDDVDHLELSLDSNPIVILPLKTGAIWKDPSSGIEITRPRTTNAISIHVAGIFKIDATVVPITDEDSRIHNYGITKDNCFAHLDINLQLYSLSDKVDGVLGQTYAPSYKSTVNTTSKMPTIGGATKYKSSGLMKADCAVARFGSIREKINNKHFPHMECGSSSHGMLCRR